MGNSVEYSVVDRIATLVINRPKVHNAFNQEVIEQFTVSFEKVSQAAEVRVILLTSVGKTFSAGADIQWMRQIANFTEEENIKDAQRMANMFRIIRESPKPVIARIQGPAFGGGIGLIAASDIAIAINTATFSLPEVKLGIIPSVITPYLIEKTGPGPLRRYGLTGEAFHAEEAKRIGLINEVANSMNELNTTVTRICYTVMENSAKAMGTYKKLISKVAGYDWDRLAELTSQEIAQIRRSPEGQEGLLAFLEKRKPKF